MLCCLPGQRPEMVTGVQNSDWPYQPVHKLTVMVRVSREMAWISVGTIMNPCERFQRGNNAGQSNARNSFDLSG